MTQEIKIGESQFVCPKCNLELSKMDLTNIHISGPLKGKFDYLAGNYCSGCYIESVFKDLPKVTEVNE